MEVDDDDARLGAQRVDLAERHGKRIVEGRHEDASHEVDDANRLAGARPAEITAAARDAGREVRRAQQLRLPRDVVEDFLLVPDVIAGGHDVDAVPEDGIGNVAGDAEARGRVLDVGDHEVDVALLDERRDGPLRDLASRLAEDVSDEQDAHVSRPARECESRRRGVPRCAEGARAARRP